MEQPSPLHKSTRQKGWVWSIDRGESRGRKFERCARVSASPSSHVSILWHLLIKSHSLSERCMKIVSTLNVLRLRRSKSRFANRIMQIGYILLFDDSDIGFIVHYYLAGSNRTICSHAKFRTNNTIVNMIGTNGRVRRQCRHVLSE